MGCLDDGLVLGLGFTTTLTKPENKPVSKVTKSSFKLFDTDFASSFDGLEPSLSLGLSGDQTNNYSSTPKSVNVVVGGTCGADVYRQASSHSTVSSFSCGRIKRERDVSGDQETEEAERVSSRISDEDEDGANARKKLRLTKEQSALLEESFKQHSTLNPKQKQALARQLNLRPRQVEVWFQNRRARTKLKQTEVDCEILKKCCETLTDENRRLQKELQELKALKLAQPFYMHMSAATLTMCPSCERIGGGVSDGATKNPFSMAPKSSHFFNPFTKPSAAC